MHCSCLLTVKTAHSWRHFDAVAAGARRAARLLHSRIVTRKTRSFIIARTHHTSYKSNHVKNDAGSRKRRAGHEKKDSLQRRHVRSRAGTCDSMRVCTCCTAAALASRAAAFSLGAQQLAGCGQQVCLRWARAKGTARLCYVSSVTGLRHTVTSPGRNAMPQWAAATCLTGMIFG